MEIPESAVLSAQSAYDYEPGHGDRAPMVAAIERALEALGITDEWAVPCLEGDCRKLCPSREAAEAVAKDEGIAVVEHRLGSPWRPQDG